MGLGGSRGRLGEAAAAFASNWRNPNLRRAQLSFLGAWTAEWAFTVALGDRRLQRAAGPSHSAWSGCCAWFRRRCSPRCCRRSPTEGAVSGCWSWCPSCVERRRLSPLLTVALSGPVFVVYALAIALDDRRDAVPARALRTPADAVPHRARAGQRQRGARSARFHRHPGRAAAGGRAARVHRRVRRVRCRGRGVVLGGHPAAAGSVRRPAAPRGAARPDLVKEAVEGIRAVTQSRDLQLILGLAAAQSLTRGALTVFSVVVAIELLGTGDPGAGALWRPSASARSIGSLGASLLVGTGPAGRVVRGGSRAVGTAHRAGRRLPRAGGGTVPARIRRRRQRADRRRRVHPHRHGWLPTPCWRASSACWRVSSPCRSGSGAILASAVIDWFGIQAALISIGLVCPVLAVLSLRRLRKTGQVRRRPRRGHRAAPAGAHVPPPAAARHRAARARPRVRRGARGSGRVTQGEIGDRYYVIESGEADVLGDGRVVATLGPGEGFGEIALLRSTRRTATVVARTRSEAARARARTDSSPPCSATRPALRPPRPESTTSSTATRPKEPLDEPPEPSPS